jgi:bifunctional non-homologous end joining protein LigD
MSAIIEAIPGGRQRPFPVGLSPMLLQGTKEPFVKTGWIFEPKLDGMRCLAYVNDGKAKLFSKPGRNITDTFPALAAEFVKQPTGVYDGEIVAHDDHGFVSFERLQERWSLRRDAEIARADRTNPVSFFAFDILHLGNISLTYVALSFRRALLEDKFFKAPRLDLVEQFEDGITLFEACREQKFEGIVAKRLDSRYQCGLRTPDWLKIKYSVRDRFVIVGQKEEEGYIVAKDGRVVGVVQYGFSAADLEALSKRLQIEREESIKGKMTFSYKPTVEVEVEFMEWTSKKQLRYPVFRKFC